MIRGKVKPKKASEETKVLDIHFLGEQDGLPEQSLKDQLNRCFQLDKSVRAAYLAKVSYDRANYTEVALCLLRPFGPDDGIVEQVGSIFASIFGAHEHLDILFINEDQEVQLLMTCKPFFKRVI